MFLVLNAFSQILKISLTEILILKKAFFTTEFDFKKSNNRGTSQERHGTRGRRVVQPCYIRFPACHWLIRLLNKKAKSGTVCHCHVFVSKVKRKLTQSYY